MSQSEIEQVSAGVPLVPIEAVGRTLAPQEEWSREFIARESRRREDRKGKAPVVFSGSS